MLGAPATAPAPSATAAAEPSSTAHPNFSPEPFAWEDNSDEIESLSSAGGRAGVRNRASSLDGTDIATDLLGSTEVEPYPGSELRLLAWIAHGLLPAWVSAVRSAMRMLGGSMHVVCACGACMRMAHMEAFLPSRLLLGPASTLTSFGPCNAPADFLVNSVPDDLERNAGKLQPVMHGR